jgi:beta-lactamase regulating signal transducer with metallopeptidase domain/thiol-disulfide isomerase/thioredoxin/protocatechuate 3,4-dioxygenase beta subunit
MNWDPGDRALDFFLIVSTGVAFLSGAAWLAAWGLSRRPATRHLILVSALFCCLGMPALAMIFTAAGWALVAIPLLPPHPEEWHSARAQVMATRRWATHEPYRPDTTALNRTSAREPGVLLGASPYGLHPSHPEIGRSRLGVAGGMRPAVAGGVAGSADKPPGVLDPERAVSPNPRSTRHGLAATLVLLASGCGSLLLLLNLARNCWRIRRLCRASGAPVAERLQRLADDVGRLLGVRQLPRVIVSVRAVTPCAVGFRRPVVVLPERLIEAVSRDEMRDVLMHEMAHIRRRDHIIVLLQELARALYWPIPTIHGLIHELGQAREELCDNHVLRCRDAISYGETLLHVAELSFEARPLGATVGILHWKSALERRIAGLLDQRRSTMTRSSSWVACLVALAFIGGGTVASATRFIAARGTDQPASGEAPAPAPAARQPDARAAAKPAVVDEKPKPPPRKSILIHALGPDGQPMAGVNIHRSVWTRKPVEDRNLDRKTDEKGEVPFDVPETLYIFRLWATAEGYVPLFAHWEENEDPERSLPAEFTFHLRKGTVIGGVIRDEDGRPIRGTKVEVQYKSGGEADGRATPNSWLATGEDARTTDDEGRWSLDNVPAGDKVSVLLNLNHPEFISDRNWGSLQEAQGVTMEALRARTATITMRRGVSVTGTVTDPHGRPVAGAVVVRGERPYWEWGSQEVRTDAQGVYRLPSLPRGPLTITVVAPGWMPSQRKVELRPNMEPVDFPLGSGKALRLRFVDRLGKSVAGVEVQIAKWRGNEALYNHRHPNVVDTQIPHQSDKDGIYQWSWAPDDSVKYTFWKEGYARQETALVADDAEQTITLHSKLRIAGKVTDAATGQPVTSVTAMPVLEFAPGNLHVERQDAETFPGGSYSLEVERTDVAYRVRVEAEGYRSAMSDAVRVGVLKPTLDFRLERATALKGRVVDAQGQPAAGARVYLATDSQMLGIEGQDEDAWSSNQRVVTDGRGAFVFPAQFERYSLVVLHDSGYAEVHREPDDQPGELTLGAWAQVEGRLMEAGRPIPMAWVHLWPMRTRSQSAPHIQDGLSAKTDQAGHFVFPRVPPLKASVRPFLSVWKESPIRSSRSVPLDIRPGQTIELDLGGAGVTVSGRVIPTGDPAVKIDIPKSLNYLIRREPGIEPPTEIRSLGFDVRRGWNGAWTDTREGHDYRETLDYHFVTLDPAGRFQIGGVPAGDYDFAIALYQPPEGGCLVSPVGTRIVRVRVTQDAARTGTFDLGEIPVAVRAGPRPGEVAPDLAFTTFTGEAVKLSELRGRYVLIDFWATWCGPCVQALPAVRKLHETYGAGDRLVVLGLSLDEDPHTARRFIQDQRIPWTQGSLGGRADAPALTRYAVVSVPAYFLIGPDGELIRSSQSIEEISEALRRALP